MQSVWHHVGCKASKHKQRHCWSTNMSKTRARSPTGLRLTNCWCHITVIYDTYTQIDPPSHHSMKNGIQNISRRSFASKTNAHRYRRLWCSYAFVLWASLIPLIFCFAIEPINKSCIFLSFRRLNYSLIWHFIWKINLISVTLSKSKRMKYSSGAKKKKWGVTVSHLEKAKRQRK